MTFNYIIHYERYSRRGQFAVNSLEEGARWVAGEKRIHGGDDFVLMSIQEVRELTEEDRRYFDAALTANMAAGK